MSIANMAVSARRVAVAGLCLVPLFSMAQGIAPAAELDWKKANETVGAFKRGHADILKWEQSQLPTEKQAESRPPALALMSVEQVVR